MANDKKIIDEKLKYNSDTTAAMISSLSLGKIDEYEYLTGEEILPQQLHRKIHEARFSY